MNKINIAIDGHAGCGKSTTAQQVAERLDYLYIDTGAMYRAVSLYFLSHGIPFEEENAEMLEALEKVEIDFVQSPGLPHREVTLNGKRVESEIRKPEISAIVSPVSVHKSVRQAMVRQQQRMGERKGVVMDGRDIGTVVLPHADLKVFMTAEVEERARRRLKELQNKGSKIQLNEVIENLKERDRIDSTREEGPLRQAEDAIVIDTTHIHIDEQVDLVLALAVKKIESTIEVQS